MEFLEGKGELSRGDIQEGVKGKTQYISDALKNLVDIEELILRKEANKHFYSLRENEDISFSNA